jgi:hypothetical protein
MYGKRVNKVTVKQMMTVAKLWSITQDLGQL